MRFHLHPTVDATLIEDGGGARLVLPSGAVWRLRAAGAALGLDDSVYLGSGEPRKSRQIVLTGSTGPSGATVRWALRRETVPPEPERRRERRGGEDRPEEPKDASAP